MLAQFGGRLLAPSHGAILKPNGAVAGRYTVSVLNAHGYAILVHALLGAQGRVAYRGVDYSALSFTGAGFPDRPLRISLLLPSGALPAPARR